MKKEFDKIRQAVEEHLHAINENTTEIEVLFDYLNELETRLEKITQRLDQLQLSQGQNISRPIIQPLTQIERKIFLSLYTEESPLSYQEIAERTSLPLNLTSDSISTLIKKGIPLSRTFANNQVFIKLEPDFKELQAKEDLINLSLQAFI